MASKVGGFFKGLVEWVLVFAVAFAAVMLIRAFVIEPYTVPTGSMQTTIEIDDCVLAEKITLELGMEAEAGDIVVFENPDGSSGHDVLVKRIIAVGGDTVDLVGGVVFVNGEALDEDYTQGATYALATQLAGVEVSYPYVVPEGYVWVMGDNRENSADSRYFGAISCDSLIGIVVARYWPLSRIGLL